MTSQAHMVLQNIAEGLIGMDVITLLYPIIVTKESFILDSAVFSITAFQLTLKGSTFFGRHF